MAKDRTTSGSYGAFLEAANRLGLGQGGQTTSSESGGQGNESIALLRLVEKAQGTQQVAELLKSSQMGYQEFTATMTQMQKTGLVTISGTGEEETVSTTPLAKQLLSLP